MHEISHIRNKDNFFKLILSLLSKTFFYIPILFPLNKTFEEIAELSADEYSLKKIREKNLILKVIAKLSLFLNSNPSLSFFSSPLLKRIDCLENNKKNNFYKPLLLTLLTFLFFISFNPQIDSCHVYCEGVKEICTP